MDYKEMNYKQRYEQALEIAQKMQENSNGMILKKWLWGVFPELKESKDEKIRKAIRGWIYTQPSQFFDGDFSKEEMLAWVEKQGKQNLVEWSEEDENIKESIKKVLANTDFNRLDIKYSFCEMITWLEKQKDYIKFPNSAYTSNKDVIEFADKYSHDVWEKLMDNFKKIENYHIGCNDVSDIVLNAIINTYNWLENQGKEKCALKSFRDEDVDKFMQYIEKQAKAYEFNLPNRGYDIYGFAKDILHWLEKQDEKKSTDKVEPKFKIRDWIVNGGANPCYVKSIFGDYYELCSCEGFEYTKHIIDINYIYHLWTIEDAKDGDVLIDEDNNIGLYLEEKDEKDDLYWHSRIYLGCDGRLRGFSIGGYHSHKNTKPATKEQRDMLFRKMKEAGYEWDAKKKEVKTIEQNPEDKVESKFKVGNWYQCIKDFFGKGVTFDKGTAYYCAKEGCLLNGCHIAIVKDLYDNFKLWTIEDAEDGDVLTANVQRGELGYDDYPFRYIPITFIYRKTNNDDYYIHSHCDMCFDGILKPSNRIFAKDFIKDIYPAGEGQRDLLFQKIKEEGYEWDGKEKEIKRIEPNTLDDDNVLLSLSLGNNQVQDILEDMGMLDDNGQCPHTAEEIFKAGMEHAFNLNREAASSQKVK